MYDTHVFTLIHMFKKHTATLWNYMHTHTQTPSTYHFLSTAK